MNQKDSAALNAVKDIKIPPYFVVREVQNLQVRDFADKVRKVIKLVQSIVA